MLFFIEVNNASSLSEFLGTTRCNLILIPSLRHYRMVTEKNPQKIASESALRLFSKFLFINKICRNVVLYNLKILVVLLFFLVNKEVPVFQSVFLIFLYSKYQGIFL